MVELLDESEYFGQLAAVGYAQMERLSFGFGRSVGMSQHPDDAVSAELGLEQVRPAVGHRLRQGNDGSLVPERALEQTCNGAVVSELRPKQRKAQRGLRSGRNGPRKRRTRRASWALPIPLPSAGCRLNMALRMIVAQKRCSGESRTS